MKNILNLLFKNKNGNMEDEMLSKEAKDLISSGVKFSLARNYEIHGKPCVLTETWLGGERISLVYDFKKEPLTKEELKRIVEEI